jgi:hypothetical protein
MIVKIPRVYIEAMPANLLEGKVKLTFSMPLNAETMKLREKIAMLKILDTAVALDITSPQGMLGETDQPPLPTAGDSDFKTGFEREAKRIYGLESSAPDALTVEKVMDAIVDELTDSEADDDRGTAGRFDKGTVTLSTKNKSVTVTGKQFSQASQNAGRKSRKLRK